MSNKKKVPNNIFVLKLNDYEWTIFSGNIFTEIKILKIEFCNKLNPRKIFLNSYNAYFAFWKWSKSDPLQGPVPPDDEVWKDVTKNLVNLEVKKKCRTKGRLRIGHHKINQLSE